MLKKLLLITLYCFFAVALTTLLLVVRFPKDRLLSFIESEIELQLSGVTCEISAPEYRYPYSIHFKKILLTRSEKHQEVQISDVLITLEPESMLTRGNISLNIWGGRVESGIIFQADIGMIEFIGMKISGIDIAKLVLLSEGVNRKMSGKVTFSGNLTGKVDELEQAELSGELTIVNFQAELRRPILKSNSVYFDVVKTAVRFQGREISLINGEAEGPLYEGDFNGQVRVGPSWQNGYISIGGDLIPKPEYIRKNPQIARAAALLFKEYRDIRIPYRVRGSLRQPTFQFGSL